MRGIIGIFIMGLLLMPVVLSAGDRVKVKGNFPIYSGISQSGGGDVVSTPSRDDGTPGVHNEQPHDGPPMMEAWPWNDELFKICFPYLPTSMKFALFLFGKLGVTKLSQFYEK